MQVSYYDIIERGLPGNRGSIPVSLVGFDNLRNCPYCNGVLNKTGLRELFDISLYSAHLKKVDQHIGIFEAQTCKECAWWQVQRGVIDEESSDWGTTRYVQAVIKRFDLASKNVPVDTLAEYLSSKGEMIYHIHHKKMEELVGAVFKEHFACEVVYCGGGGDRGIDLFLVLSDEMIPVQVKRRTKPGATEPVTTIRDMLGVMHRDQNRKSIIVSTAEKFSKDAIRDTETVLAHRTADAIELINLENFLSIMRQYFKGTEKNFMEVAKRLITFADPS